DGSEPPPPSLAYLISGSSNDSGQMVRLLHAIYHPKNQYLLRLDGSATQKDRESLAVVVQSVPLFWALQNVHVVGKADSAAPANGEGPSALSSTLHGASLLLHVSSNWDWLINLHADCYPLVTQDDLLHILSYLPKDLNFIKHSSYIGWRESGKLKPIIVDPGLYNADKRSTYTFFATQKRALPDAFRLFSGHPTAVLSRGFVEYCIAAAEDNLPRTLLMYLTNTPVSSALYFPTLACNSPGFNRTAVDHAFQVSRGADGFDGLILSGAAFASPFGDGDGPVLDRIDREILRRRSGGGGPAPGGWCLDGESGCRVLGDAEVLVPGPGAGRLQAGLVRTLSNST
ncbi:hypothetical protein M569_05800, partial [Genlisea aurea]